jgi:hypothetical protein
MGLDCPRPKKRRYVRAEMATVDGVLHRLYWLNRSKRNYELRCRSGWTGPDRSSFWGRVATQDELRTMKAGNSHIRSIARARQR